MTSHLRFRRVGSALAAAVAALALAAPAPQAAPVEQFVESPEKVRYSAPGADTPSAIERQVLNSRGVGAPTMAPSDRSAEATGPFDYAAAALAALLLTGLAATAVVRHGRARTA